MSSSATNPIIAELRERIAVRENGNARARNVLPFGVPGIDARLPGGGLAFGALHEIAGGGGGTIDGAAAALFVAGIAARTKGKCLWCLTRPDLFFPALSQAGLHPDRVIFCESDREGGPLLWRARIGDRRAGALANDGLAPFAARRREDRLDGDRPAALAATERGFRLWPTDGFHHALEDQRVAVGSIASGGRRQGKVAGGTDARKGGRVRRV